MALAFREVMPPKLKPREVASNLHLSVKEESGWRMAQGGDFARVHVSGGPRMSSKLRNRLEEKRRKRMEAAPTGVFCVTDDAPEDGLPVHADKIDSSKVLQRLPRGSVIKIYVAKSKSRGKRPSNLPPWVCMSYPIFHGCIRSGEKRNGYIARPTAPDQSNSGSFGRARLSRENATVTTNVKCAYPHHRDLQCFACSQ